MSLLPVAQYCGLAPKLSGEHGAGRAAAMSSAFHAMCADAPDAKVRWALLSDDEQAELADWKRPDDVALPGGILLRYADAEKELAVALDDWGQATSDAKAATVGHLDFAWVVGDVAYVADIKKSVWSSSGPDSLQLHAYGLAYAALRECDAYVTGIWIPTDAKWFWSTETVWLDSDEGRKQLDRVLAAARNDGEANKGAHCSNCFNRMHCKEWVLPVIDTGSTQLLRTGCCGIKPSNEDALAAVVQLMAAKDVIKAFEENMKEWVRRGLLQVKDPNTGMVWAPVEMTGRESVSAKDLRAALGDGAERYIKKGNSYSQYRWLKEST